MSNYVVNRVEESGMYRARRCPGSLDLVLGKDVCRVLGPVGKAVWVGRLHDAILVDGVEAKADIVKLPWPVKSGRLPCSLHVRQTSLFTRFNHAAP
ncbi:hypothetical protein [Paraburkholderia ferrariae]|uniref:Uncharacterized protein n=1 Tax=Paraburkholderia ferrariae TaxID=386056 RepID=A0ABU9S4H7_9BURK